MEVQMAVSNTMNYGWSGSGGASVTGSDTPSANTLYVENFTATANATTHIVNPFVYTALQSAYILSTHDLTLKTNSSGSPAQTFVIKAGVPFAWSVNSGITNPFSVTVTSTYWVNASPDTDAQVNVRLLHNA